MAYKFVLIAALAAVASGVEHAVSHQSINFHTTHQAAAPAYHHVAAAPVYHAAPIVYQHAAPVYKHIVQEEHHAPAHYSFEYAVHDEHTGDIKEQKETREGDKVQGYYTLKEADGTRRIVHYTADKHSGFNAIVTHEGKAAVHAAPVVKAAPVLVKTAPVLLKAAPVHHVAAVYQAAPIAHTQTHVSFQDDKSSYHY